MRLWRWCYWATVQCHSVLLSGREHAGDHLPGRRPQSRRGLAKNVGNLVSEFSIHRNAMNGISLLFGLNPAARRTSRAPRAAVSLPKKTLFKPRHTRGGCFARVSEARLQHAKPTLWPGRCERAERRGFPRARGWVRVGSRARTLLREGLSRVLGLLIAHGGTWMCAANAAGTRPWHLLRG